MDTCRGQCDHNVACRHTLVIDNLLFIHYANGEARKIVFIVGHHTGMLCGFAADKCRARLYAALCNACN